MERTVQTSNLATGAGSRPPLPSECDDRMRYRQAHSGWTAGPLALAAADLTDLEDPGSAETIRSLIQISQTLEREQFMIVNLEFLVPDGASDNVAERVNMLRCVIDETVSEMNLSAPRYALEERGPSLDLRVKLTFH